MPAAEPASPTSNVVPVRAYAFAATFRLRELAALFEGAEVSLAMDELHATFSDGSTAIGFDFGVLVFFDGSEALREAMVRKVAAQAGEKRTPRTEELLVELAPAGAAPIEVRFDRVLVPELTWPVRSVVGLVIAQSAAMEYYEDHVSEILEQTDRITQALSESGRMRGRVRDTVRFIGHCIETKNEVVETLALFDKPDVTWESEQLDRLFTRLREMMEIDDRFRALEYRLRTIQDSLVLLVELSRGESTFRLELLVVLLIFLELAVMLWQVVTGGHG